MQEGGVMRTTLNVKDSVLSDVVKMTGAKSQTEAVNKALAEWIRQKRLERLRGLRGKVKWEGDLDRLRSLDEEGGQ
jgi:Arc/MetJ family transcription regulator